MTISRRPSTLSPSSRAALLAALLLAPLVGCAVKHVDTSTPAGSSGSSGASGQPGGGQAGGGTAGGGTAGGSNATTERREGPAARATEGIHVAPSGSDQGGDGSAARPFRTVQHALDSAASAGSVVLLHEGSYAESVRIRHSNLVLQAVPGQKARITCPVSIDENEPLLCVEIDAETQGVTLRGLDISGGFYAVYLGSQWDYDSTPLDNATARGVTIEDCTLHDSGRDVVKIPAGCDDVTIRRCEIFNSGKGYGPGVPQEDRNAEGIDAVNADRLRVADSYIHDTATTCLYVKGGSIGTVIERVRAERCGDVGIALGFDTSPEFFDTKANPGYYENIGGTVRNCVVRDTGLAGIGLFASRDAQVLHNTLIHTATRDHAALYLGVATQDYAPAAGRPANLSPTLIGNLVDQSGVSAPRCFGIRHSVEDELGVLSGLDGAITLRNNLYFAGSSCAFSDGRPASPLDGGDLAAWQAHAPGFDAGSTFQNPALDPTGHLSPGSPAIDAAGSTPGVALDIDGQARKAPFDIGADER